MNSIIISTTDRLFKFRLQGVLLSSFLLCSLEFVYHLCVKWIIKRIMITPNRFNEVMTNKSRGTGETGKTSIISWKPQPADLRLICEMKKKEKTVENTTTMSAGPLSLCWK